MPAPTVPTSHFDDLIRPYVREAPVPVIRRHARSAAIEFCERTNVWREIVTVTVDEAPEIVVVPTYAAIHRIEEAVFNDRKLTATQYTDVSQAEWAADGAPEYIAQVNPNTVTLIPHEDGVLTLSLFLKPINGTDMQLVDGQPADALDVVPDFLFKNHARAIADGALSSLLMIPRQAFSDPQRATFYLSRFERAMDANFASNITMQHRPPARARMHEF